MELKIEILLVSFTNLILTLNYSVLTYNTDWNDNVKWNILHIFSLCIATDRTQLKNNNIVRHKIKKCGLTGGNLQFEKNFLRLKSKSIIYNTF